MSLTLITGGVRSGKSQFGEDLASAGKSVLYIATGVRTDEEMKTRIELHQKRRPVNWTTLEEPASLLATLPYYAACDTVLIDCLSTWISNRMIQVAEEQWRDPLLTQAMKAELAEWLNAASTLQANIIVISTEAGLGGVAMSRLGRWFQDVLGEANQMVAQAANEVYAVLSGIPLRLKG